MSQGFPDFSPPDVIVEAAVEAIRGAANQYTVTWGYPPLREILAAQYTAQLGWTVDPDIHVCVVCGVTEGINDHSAGAAESRRRVDHSGTGP